MRLQPVVPDSAAIKGWSDRWPIDFQLAQLWNRYAPRGKGAVPRWVGRSCGQDRRVICRCESGVQIAIDPPSLDVYITIRREGTWEPWIIRALRSFLCSKDVIYDVGANVGCISLELATDASLSVYAFEPQPRLARVAAISACLNSFENLRVYSAALGERSGEVTLHVPSHSVHASLRSSGQSETTLSCPIFSLDDLVENGTLPPPNVIKIDVEGAEWQVLRGAERTLRKYAPALLVEANDNAGRFDYTRENILDWIAGRGDYRFFRVAPGDVLVVPRIQADKLRDRYPAIAVLQ